MKSKISMMIVIISVLILGLCGCGKESGVNPADLSLVGNVEKSKEAKDINAIEEVQYAMGLALSLKNCSELNIELVYSGTGSINIKSPTQIINSDNDNEMITGFLNEAASIAYKENYEFKSKKFIKDDKVVFKISNGTVTVSYTGNVL